LKFDPGILLQNIKLKFLTFVVLFLSANLAFSDCSPDRVRFKMGESQAEFTVEVADTDEARAKGLMFRQSLPKFSGMLFVYDFPQSISFWMQNTLIPLDMIFLDQTGTVTNVHSDAVPLDKTVIFGGDSIFAVLEINGGLAKKLRISTGSVLQHPAFDQKTAAWACNN
jgi:uncharacterized membrane protein (UPF0127 family)